MFRLPLAGHIVVRYYMRKPIWMPTAPSKLFRITEHKLYKEDEVQLIGKLHKNYKTQLRSIQALMREEFYEPATQAGGLPKSFIEQEAKEEERLLEENRLENERVARSKMFEFTNELTTIEHSLFEKKIGIEEKIVEDNLKLDDLIRKELENKDFVTPDNIDQCIEDALSKPVSYDFCLDLRGKKHLFAPKHD